MKFELEEFHRDVSDEELISDLKRVALELDKTAISITDYKKLGKYGKTTYIRKFGSWSNSLQKAGLHTTRASKNLSEEDLFQNIEEIWIKLGRQPRLEETRKPLSKYDARVYLNRFGNWRKALEAFVVFVNNEEHASSEEAIKSIEAEPFTRHKTGRGINWRLRFIVMRRDNFKCRNCGRSSATDPSIILHVDHIKAWANDGETVLENLQTLCSKCNIGKSDLE